MDGSYSDTCPKERKGPGGTKCYHPISLLRCVGKLVERIINNRVISYKCLFHIQIFPSRVDSSSFADDLGTWTSEEFISTANNRMQQVLSMLEEWLKPWLVKISEEKITCAVITFSNKTQRNQLVLSGKILRRMIIQATQVSPLIT